MWDAGLNAHYLFFISDRVTVYPLVGAGILGTKAGEYGDYSMMMKTKANPTRNLALNLAAVLISNSRKNCS
jgi:hypothetical protein